VPRRRHIVAIAVAQLATGALFSSRRVAAAEPPPVPEVTPEIAGSEGAPADPDDAVIGRALQLVLRGHGGDIYGCYDRALTTDRADLAGEVLMRLWVSPGGAIARVDVLKDQVGSRVLGNCLKTTMVMWRVPELAGSDTRQVVFPLVFKPEAGKGAPPAHVDANAPPPTTKAGPPPTPPSTTTPPQQQPAPTTQAQPPAADRQLVVVVPLAEGKPGPLGLQGKVEARILVDPVTAGATQAALSQLVLHPTARLAPHTHPGVLEVLYVVKGLARVRSARKGEVAIANAGDLIVVPPSGMHSVESAPLASLTLLQLFAPAGPEHAYRDPMDRSGTLSAARSTERVTDAPVIVRAGSARPYPILDGKGQVRLLLDSLPISNAAVQRFEAEAGAEVPLHAHDRSDEVIYVLSGRAQLSSVGKTWTVGPNDAVHITMGTPHTLRVTERLVALQCYAPAGPEQRFKPKP
jgi:quercetin dioxygenase-like cupin family protein